MSQIDLFRGEYAFLSNFQPCRIEYDGVHYKSVESAYQAQKTYSIQHQIEISKMNAYDAKKAGRFLEQRKLVRKDWLDIRLKVMNELLILKFKQYPFKDLLLETGNAELIEGNTWGDRYWGRCDGIGQNMLGKLLMLRRKRLIIEAMPQILEEELFLP
jgi:ribA/ribD-fused uncharacterized protein